MISELIHNRYLRQLSIALDSHGALTATTRRNALRRLDSGNV